MNKKIQQILNYEPSIDKVKAHNIFINIMSNTFITNKYIDELDIPIATKILATTDLILRLQYAYKILKGLFDLRMIAKIEDLVIKRWKDGIPLVEWECKGFLRYK